MLRSDGLFDRNMRERIEDFCWSDETVAAATVLAAASAFFFFRASESAICSGVSIRPWEGILVGNFCE